MKKLVTLCAALIALMSMAVSASAADYTFETAGVTDYYSSTNYEDLYDAAYRYGETNQIDFDIPELKYCCGKRWVSRFRLPGCRQLQARQHLRGAGAITEEQKAIVLDSLDDGESRRYRMRIWHDTSYLTDRDKLMIDRGLARDGYHSLRFSFVYTPEEREQNRQMSMMSNSMHQERWHQICVQDAVRRSDAMHQVMEEISKQFVCYQYDKDQSLR